MRLDPRAVRGVRGVSVSGGKSQTQLLVRQSTFYSLGFEK